MDPSSFDRPLGRFCSSLFSGTPRSAGEEMSSCRCPSPKLSSSKPAGGLGSVGFWEIQHVYSEFPIFLDVWFESAVY